MYKADYLLGDGTAADRRKRLVETSANQHSPDLLSARSDSVEPGITEEPTSGILCISHVSLAPTLSFETADR